jgi:transmembrane sensor
MDRQRRSRLNTQISDEACEWFVENRAGDLDEAARREFDHWLRTSPQHLSAYLEVAAIWNEGPALDPTRKWDIDSLVAAAARGNDNVVCIAATPAGSPDPPPPNARASNTRRSRLRRWSIAASAAVIVCGAGFWAWRDLSRVSVYSTQIGEQRSIELADGSTVDLNSRTEVRVRYGEHERSIELLKGEALFRVAKDPARPFIVEAEGTRVRAVGTQFDVYKRQSGTVVSVVEGRVSVHANQPDREAAVAGSAAPARNAPGNAGMLLSAGEQVTVTPRIMRLAERPNIAGVTAWRQRQIVFDSASLSEVAEEFNRYNERQLVIENPDSFSFHISGIFSSTDPNSLLRFLRNRPEVRISETAGEIRVSKEIS